MTKDASRNANHGTKKSRRPFAEPRAEELTLALELEETPPPVRFSALVSAICVLMVAGLVWSGVTVIDEVTRAQGSVTPAGNVVAIQHLEGGIVREILVEEGEWVSEGQVLLRLAPADAEAKLDQLLARRAALTLSIDRERAIAADTVFNPGGDPEADVPLQIEQAALFDAQIEAFTAQRDVLESQIEQRRSETATLETQLAQARSKLAVIQEELDQRSELFDRGLTTRDRYYASQRDLIDTRAQLADTDGRLTLAREQLAESEKRLRELDSTFRSEARQRINDLSAELAEVQAAIREAADQTARLEITTPVSGVVTGLAVGAINSVIAPGERILDVVPTDDRMVAAVRISPQDIGLIEIGQEADVRVATYDFATFGALRGRIERVSATTFQDEDGNPYYKGQVEFDRGFFGNDPDRFRVLPGMTVEADIRTGSKSLLAYMLKPVSRGWASAFNEK